MKRSLIPEYPRAQIYREINKIPDDLGTAVNVQSMVFGNMGDTSGTGVALQGILPPVRKIIW